MLIRMNGSETKGMSSESSRTQQTPIARVEGMEYIETNEQLNAVASILFYTMRSTLLALR